MFDERLLEKCHQLNEEWKKVFARRYSSTEFKLRTDSGVPLKPVYTPEDIQDAAYEKIGMPGVYPFTRGAYPIQYQFQPPMSQHALGFGLPEHSRERYEAYRRSQPLRAKERFGCKNLRSMRPIIAMQTAGSTFTAQQPLNNLLRAGFQTLAAGLVGADVIWTTPYDEAIGIHSEESSTLAFRTQQIIYHETNIPNVTDPLGGSYYLEWLTNGLETKANELLNRVEEIGFFKAWETGWFRSEIEKTASEHHRQVENREKIIVGVNAYAVEEDKGKIKATAVDPHAEEIAIKRVKGFKANRNNTKTQEQLKRLEEKASRIKDKWPNGGDLIPAILEAAKADATMGEITQVIKDVFGFHKRFY